MCDAVREQPDGIDNPDNYEEDKLDPRVEVKITFYIYVYISGMLTKALIFKEKYLRLKVKTNAKYTRFRAKTNELRFKA